MHYNRNKNCKRIQEEYFENERKEEEREEEQRLIYEEQTKHLTIFEKYNLYNKI